jgi:hypothetical protein
MIVRDLLLKKSSIKLLRISINLFLNLKSESLLGKSNPLTIEKEGLTAAKESTIT